MGPMPSQGIDMKINWGTGVVISFILFIGFILFLVLMMTSNAIFLSSKDKKLIIVVASENNNIQHELVTEEYYKKGTYYQDEIDAEKNAQLLSENIKVKTSSKGVEIIFPKNLNFENIDGIISFYRPSNKKLDFNLPIELSSHSLLIPDHKVVEGKWGISIVWKYEGVNYMFKDTIAY
jgi:hypothetical protein